MVHPGEPPRRFWPSTAALLAGLVVAALLSVAAGQAWRWLEISAAEADRWMLIAGGVAVLAGGYVSAKLAPRRPLRHAVELGFLVLAIKLVVTFSALGVASATSSWETLLPLAIVLPCAWLGGQLHAGRR